MINTKFAVVWVLLFFGFVPSLCQAAGEMALSEIRFSSEGDEVVLTMDVPGGQARLRATGASPEKSLVFDVRPLKKPHPIAGQAVLLKALLDRYFEKKGREGVYRFRMEFYEEMKPRLIAAAAESPVWDRKKGSPRNTHINAFVTKLMNARRLYPELQTIFDPLGYDIEVAGVEKASQFVRSARDIGKKGIPLPPSGVSPEDRFPTEAVINYFRLTMKR